MVQLFPPHFTRLFPLHGILWVQFRFGRSVFWQSRCTTISHSPHLTPWATSLAPETKARTSSEQDEDICRLQTHSLELLYRGISTLEATTIHPIIYDKMTLPKALLQVFWPVQNTRKDWTSGLPLEASIRQYYSFGLSRFTTQTIPPWSYPSVFIYARSLTDLEAIAVVPDQILDRRLIKKGNHAIPQVLITWTGLSKDVATWKDYHVVKTRFPKAPAWGQAASSVRGDVTAHGWWTNPGRTLWPKAYSTIYIILSVWRVGPMWRSSENHKTVTQVVLSIEHYSYYWIQYHEVEVPLLVRPILTIHPVSLMSPAIVGGHGSYMCARSSSSLDSFSLSWSRIEVWFGQWL